MGKPRLRLKAVLVVGTCLGGLVPNMVMAEGDGAVATLFPSVDFRPWVQTPGNPIRSQFSGRMGQSQLNAISGPELSTHMGSATATSTTPDYGIQAGSHRISSSANAASSNDAAGRALPTGGQVVFGGVNFDTRTPNSLAIVQSTDKAITSWATFDIGTGYNVAIRQPNANAAMLARVRGDAPSLIAGQLSANGQVVLVNPNGIAIGAGAKIDTGSFVASTLDIADADFLKGNLTFRRTGKAATVVNQGTINASKGVALLGSGVVNEGAVSARLGRIGYGAGDLLTVDFTGDQFLSIAIPVSEAAELTDVLGRPLTALVTAGGTTRADGGQIYLSAQAARDVMLAAVKIDGELVANSVREGSNGRISLGSIAIDGGNGRVQVGGTLTATGASKLNGGAINFAGGDVNLTAKIDASGDGSGGVVRVRGDVISAGGSIIVNGLRGMGGRVNIEAARYAALTGTISANGIIGGNVIAHSGNHLLTAGTIQALGTLRTGGNITLSADHRVVATSQSLVRADGGMAGGSILVAGGTKDEYAGLFTSGAYTARALSGIGGTIRFEGGDIDLVAAYADASGSAGGGRIMVGYTGDRANPQINARTIDANAYTKLIADAGGRGNGGLVALWSKDRTTMQGDLSARGGAFGGNGGFLEVSSRGEIGFTGVADAGAPVGQAGTFLLDPKNIIISTSGSNLPSYGLIDPNAGANAFGSRVELLSSGNVVVADQGADIGATDTGAVYLYNLTTGALISQVNGTTQNDGVGNGGITILSNGNYVVQSANWNNGLATNAGAVTWGSRTSGVSGAVSAANSLVGTQANDFVGNLGITALSNGNYVVRSDSWDNGTAVNAGAVTWGSGTSGVVGAVSATNSLVGTSASERVGNAGITALNNGNYLVSSNFWNGNRGAVTWGSGTSGVSGAVSATNSLVGSTANDQVGAAFTITTLTNGNYVVRTRTWDNGAIANVGAVTWGSGTSGVVGAISASNSLVGTTTGDQVGVNGITELTNGNYVVSSRDWNGSRGAVTWGSGTAGVTGAVSASNSLVGTTANDRVGQGGITALSNGNYVVNSFDWNASRGAVTWGNGTSGTVGVVSATNSLVGSQINDLIGYNGVVALTNGNYVVISDSWANGAATAAGAVTWGSGAGGIVGAVSASNSLVGTATTDLVGRGGVIALSNGNYLVYSNNWSANRGAVTWGNGTSGVTGTVSASNSLVGSSANDYVGRYGIGTLTNGNYVVLSADWNSGRGAATWGSGTSGIAGAVSSANSLVGTTASDHVGSLITVLTNGNYVVRSSNWNENKGAATWGNGASGIVGAVSATNSLVGTSDNDFVGSGGVTALSNGNYVVASQAWGGGRGATTWSNGTSGIVGSVSASNSLVGSVSNDFVGNGGVTALSNGNYVVRSSNWANGAVAVAGAVTWGSGTSGIVGAVSATNSLVGTTENDAVGSSGILALSNGNYIVRSLGWDNGVSADAGAVTWGSGTSGVSGAVSATNSLVGSVTNSDFTFKAVGPSGEVIGASDLDRQILVGLTDPSSISFSRALGQTLSIHPDFLTRTLNTGTAVTLQASNDITVSSDIIVNNPSGNGGWLTMQAGRSLLINANISTDNGNLTLVANERAGAGVVAADRDPGAAVLSMAPGTSINAGTGAVNLSINDGAGRTGTSATSGNITLNSITAGTLTVANNGPTAGSNIIVTAGNLFTVSGTNRAIDIRAPRGTFTNNAGTGLFNLTGGGTYGVWSDAPDTTTEGVTGYLKRYNVANESAFAALNPGGSFFAYRIAPVLTVTGPTLTRVYGNANPAFNPIITGFIDGDTAAGSLTGAALLTTTATGASNVGTYAIMAGLGTLASAEGYQFTFVNGSLGVTARNLTVTANPLSRIYGNANPALTYTVGGDGLVNGDSLSGALATTASATSNVGTYAITQGNLANSNYAITYVGANLSVTARPLTVLANGLSRIYGNTNPALTYTIGGDGLANGDSLSGALATAATATSNVGTYAITQGTLTASSNYALTYIGANLAVTARPLTITANALSRIYGNANPTLTYTIGGQGLVNGDSLSGALATVATSAFHVGSYAITQGTLANSNYAILFIGANLTVTARPVTVTADALSRIYGNANPTLTYTGGGQGVVNGDTLSGALATTASATSNVGTYAITQGTLAANSNYILTFAGGNLSVIPRPLTVTANALSRIYGNTNPALTYTIGGNGLVNGDTLSGGLATTANVTSNVGSYAITRGNLAANSNYALTYVGAELAVTARPLTIRANALSRIYGNGNPALTYAIDGDGLINGDVLSGALATTAAATSNVGTYAITQGTLANSNYAINYVGANLTVLARNLTVTANALSRIYGNANPTLTYTVGGQGLVNGDSLSGALATTALATSNVGTYAITQGTLANSNYAITYVGANLSITARPIGVQADSLRRFFGFPDPRLTYTIFSGSLANGDTLSGNLVRQSGDGVGTYAINQGTLANPNYLIDYRPGTFTIDPSSGDLPSASQAGNTFDQSGGSKGSLLGLDTVSAASSQSTAASNVVNVEGNDNDADKLVTSSGGCGESAGGVCVGVTGQ
jgi:filamentous hemagglutinin family protein